MFLKSNRTSFFFSMGLLVLVVVVLVALVGCSDDEDCPTCPEDPISFRKVGNAALYAEADYENMLLYVVNDGTAERCQGICKGDPECTFFYFNERGGLFIAPLETAQYDCAFFRGTLWIGGANQSDTYVKQVNGVDAWEALKARYH